MSNYRESMSYWHESDDDFDGGVTDEQWSAIRKLAAKGDTDKLIAYLFDIGSTINPAAAPLFIIAVAEQKRLSAMVEAAKVAEPKIADLDREREFAYRAAANTDPATARKRIDEIESQLSKLRDEQSHAYAARVHLQGIVRRFPALFEVQPLTNPDGTKRWPPVVDSASPAVDEAMRKVRLPNETTINPWRHFPPIELPAKPRKRLAAFGSAE